MKKLILPLLAILTLVSSCKDDFEINAPYKQVTLAYGIINREDTAHYIRIMKAFMDENKSAIELSKIPDSSFYDPATIDVVMNEYQESSTTPRRSWAMTSVDLNKEGYQKDEPGNLGFFTSPNKAYKLKLAAGDSLDPYYKYRLVITNKKSGTKDSSEYIYVVNSRRDKGNPNDFYIGNFTNLNYVISFSKTTLRETYTLTGKCPKNGRNIEGMIRFHMVEKNAATNTKKRVYADFFFDSEARQAAESFELSVLNSSIYGFFRDAFGPPAQNIVRYVDSCDIYVFAASNELYNYYVIANVQSSSLLGDQIKPVYSNMLGSNSYGIIASRAVRSYKNVPITKETIDSLRLNPVTINLGIQGPSDE